MTLKEIAYKIREDHGIRCIAHGHSLIIGFSYKTGSSIWWSKSSALEYLKSLNGAAWSPVEF